ncbi:MAG: bleomycin resistance protein [Acidobacteria bacterium]|nr:MAG: bleomycin resistance protein [Acidobacteriota bacterium]
MNRMSCLLLFTLLICGSVIGQKATRPRVLGVAHMALYVNDLQAARAFYKDFLGFAEPFVLKRDDGSDRIAFIKINDEQYIELFAEAPKQDGHLNHIAFYTDSAAAMRQYLATRGVKVPDKVGKGQIGNLNFNILDPDGHTVEIVQYQPDSWTLREKSKFMPDTRISTHIAHIGVLVGALDPAMNFYRDILGFEDFWRGGPSSDVLSWVNMRVPDGKDYLEFMLYSAPPDAGQIGVKNHICLITPDIKAAVAILESHPSRKSYSRPIEIKVGKNGKRQANLFDPDGTRIELMEPDTVDGKPVPTSKAPAPVR